MHGRRQVPQQDLGRHHPVATQPRLALPRQQRTVVVHQRRKERGEAVHLQRAMPLLNKGGQVTIECAGRLRADAQEGVRLCLEEVLRGREAVQE